VPEFKGPLPDSDTETTRASAQLPGLDIEIVHRRSPDGGAEQLTVTLQAAPSFDAFARYLEAANPFAFWMQTAQLGWWPWLETTRAMMLPWTGMASLPKPSGSAVSRSRPQ